MTVTHPSTNRARRRVTSFRRRTTLTSAPRAQELCSDVARPLYGPHVRLVVKRGSPYSITERRVPELISVLDSQPASDVSHKPGGKLPLVCARPAVTPATVKRAAANLTAW